MRLEEKAKAQAMATALATIGKFVIKKKVGEGEAIFGSVTAAEIVDAIRMQVRGLGWGGGWAWGAIADPGNAILCMRVACWGNASMLSLPQRRAPACGPGSAGRNHWAALTWPRRHAATPSHRRGANWTSAP